MDDTFKVPWKCPVVLVNAGCRGVLAFAVMRVVAPRWLVLKDLAWVQRSQFVLYFVTFLVLRVMHKACLNSV